MRRFFLAAGYPVGVDIEEHLRGTVAQAILGVFDADAVCREAAGVIVPETPAALVRRSKQFKRTIGCWLDGYKLF